MKKRIMLWMMILCMTFLMYGCGKESEKVQDKDEIISKEEKVTTVEEKKEMPEFLLEGMTFEPGLQEYKDDLDIKEITVGYKHAVVLEKDGTADFLFGENLYGEGNVDEWSDLVDIEAGTNYTLGLKADGTVVSTGDNSSGQCEVSQWSDICDISADKYFSAGVSKYGTVVVTDKNLQELVNEWEEIVQVAVGETFIAGLKVDGTVVIEALNDTKLDSDYKVLVKEWKNIVQIDAGIMHVVGLKTDGTVVAINNNIKDDKLKKIYDACEVSEWENIVSISANGYATAACASDGTEYITGHRISVQADGSQWLTVSKADEGRVIVDVQVGGTMEAFMYKRGGIGIIYEENGNTEWALVEKYSEHIDEGAITQFDFEFIEKSASAATFDIIFEWMDEHGYYYVEDRYNPAYSGETPNGWSFDGSTMDMWKNDWNIDNNIHTSMSKIGDSETCKIIWEKCLEELNNKYGAPNRAGEDYAWYTDGFVVIAVMNYDDCIQVEFGTYIGMKEFLD